MQPLIAIDYDEFHPETYRGVMLKMPGRPWAKLSDDGGPVPALRAAVDVALTAERPMFMSSVDHFITDLPAVSEQREDLIAIRDGNDAAWRPASE